MNHKIMFFFARSIQTRTFFVRSIMWCFPFTVLCLLAIWMEPLLLNTCLIFPLAAFSP